MSAKKIFPCALVLAVLGLGTAGAQEMLPPPEPYQPGPGPATTPADALPSPAAHIPAGLSSWMTYTRPDCCGPIGGDGPIKMELFLRSGISLPVEGSIFGHVLETGWVIEGGGRSLFFNLAMDSAWAIDLSISNVYNHGQRSDIRLPYRLTLPNSAGVNSTVTTAVTVRELNRTFANVSLGHEWYLWGSAATCCTKPAWRVGIDGGGRLGSAKARFNEIQHHTDTVSAAFVALHTDLEIPRGCCTFLFGFRAEWDYTWMDILQIQNNSDMEDVNFLLTVGVRF